MGSSTTDNLHLNSTKGDEDCLYAIQLVSGTALPMVMQTAIELDLFEIIAKAGNEAKLSSPQIASQLKPKNPQAPKLLDRMLRLLASHNVLTCTTKTCVGGAVERFYGLSPVGKYLVSDENGVSFAPWVFLNQNKSSMESWPRLKEAILDGGDAFSLAHGVHAFEYFPKQPQLGELFNKVMFNNTTITMSKLLEKYKGFEEVKEVVDVGGGVGTMSGIITAKYPSINCINLDLPHVVQNAPSFPRVKHVGGDMFASIPKGETILLKWVLHNWDDENCIKLLKKCHEALPDNGKMIIVDAVLPEEPESDAAARGICQIDMIMMAYHPTGTERTKKEFESLASLAGFAGIKLICPASIYWVMELYKKMLN